MKSKKLVLTFWFLSIIFQSAIVQAQRRADATPNDAPVTTPKLVVGIVVDQMRYDYLTRFWKHFGKDGFKRLVGQGFLAGNHHFN